MSGGKQSDGGERAETERLRALVERPTLMDVGAKEQAEKFVTQRSRRMIECNRHRPVGTNVMVWACRHAVEGTQDPEHPVGMVALPGSVFVCKRCDKLIDENKFHIETEMVAQCYGCVMDFSKWLFAKNPDLLVDKTKNPV